MFASRVAWLSGALEAFDEDEVVVEEEEEEEDGEEEDDRDAREAEAGEVVVEGEDEEESLVGELELSSSALDGDSLSACETAAALPVPVEPDPEADPDPEAVSPSLSSTCARFAAAACRVARDCSSVTSALFGFSSASS